MIGLDTTAIIDLFKKDANLKKLLENIDDTFSTTVLNYQEIFFGLNPKDPKYDVEKDFYDDFFNNLILLDFDKESVKKSSDIFWDLSKRGEPIGRFDCMISGAFLKNNVGKIITKNAKHFQKIKGIKVLTY